VVNTLSVRLLSLPRWARFVAVWILWMVLCAPQTKWSEAAPKWSEVFWIQINFWTPWAILSLGIFKLCEWLYDGPRTLSRYVPALLLGAIAAALLDPLIENALLFLEGWGKWMLGLAPERPADFLAKFRFSAVKGSGTNPFMFAVIAIAWQALRYGQELREKQVKALELESRLREAQLQALRSQLNPHFLFNTLHSIAELVHQNPDLAEQLILRLGDLLREVLASSNEPEIALAEEIKFIKAYLDIEQMRLGNRLKLEWDIAEDVLELKVPSLVLQPLVENAIQHGIASSTQPGQLRIRAKREADFLHLQVRDSGPGLPAADGRLNAGIGLTNTEARLRTIYGEKHEFRLTNHDGLTVDLRLPITEKPWHG
jgi:two-component system LytT family sensor kinase